MADKKIIAVVGATGASLRGPAIAAPAKTPAGAAAPAAAVTRSQAGVAAAALLPPTAPMTLRRRTTDLKASGGGEASDASESEQPVRKRLKLRQCGAEVLAEHGERWTSAGKAESSCFFTFFR